MPYDGVDALNKRGELIEKIDPSPENPPFGAFAIKCTLYNVGAGPPLNLRIKFRFPNRGGWATEPWELSPLGPGESRGDRNSPSWSPSAFKTGSTRRTYRLRPVKRGKYGLNTRMSSERPSLGASQEPRAARGGPDP